MANPITEIKRMEFSKEEIQERDIAEVTEAVSANKEAILKGIDLLATINDSGALDAINALVKHKQDALENIVEEINKPQYASTLENLSELFFFFGHLKMDELAYFMEKLNHGMEEAHEVTGDERTSYMGIIKSLKDPEINRSITMLLSFLRGMGRE